MNVIPQSTPLYAVMTATGEVGQVIAWEVQPADNYPEDAGPVLHPVITGLGTRPESDNPFDVLLSYGVAATHHVDIKVYPTYEMARLWAERPR